MAVKIANSKEIAEFVRREFQVIIPPKVINSPTGDILESLLEKFVHRILEQPAVYKSSDIAEFNEFFDASCIRSASIFLVSKCLFDGFGVPEFTISDLKSPTPKMFRKLMTIVINILEVLHASKKDEIMEELRKQIKESTTKMNELHNEKNIVSEELNSLHEKIFSSKAVINKVNEDIAEKDNYIERLKTQLKENDCSELRETILRIEKERQDFEIRVDSKKNKIAELESANAKIKQYIAKKTSIQQNIKVLREDILTYRANSSVPRKSMDLEKYNDFYKLIMRAEELHDKEKRMREELKEVEHNSENIKDELKQSGPLLQQLSADVEQLSKDKSDLVWKIDDLKKRTNSELTSLKEQEQQLKERTSKIKELELQKEGYLREIAQIEQATLDHKKTVEESWNLIEMRKSAMRAEMKREEDIARSLVEDITNMVLDL